MDSGNLSDRLYHSFGRSHIFVVTWLAYAGFYLCRKNFSVTMPLLVEQVGWNKLQLVNVLFGYSLMYCSWQFVNGYLSDRLGARLVVGAGLFMAVFSNFAMGMTISLGLMLLLLSCINGAGNVSLKRAGAP
jgi:OPA family glycerol-3-phosphate transporter-like MFS transporter